MCRHVVVGVRISPAPNSSWLHRGWARPAPDQAIVCAFLIVGQSMRAVKGVAATTLVSSSMSTGGQRVCGRPSLWASRVAATAPDRGEPTAASCVGFASWSDRVGVALRRRIRGGGRNAIVVHGVGAHMLEWRGLDVEGDRGMGAGVAYAVDVARGPGGADQLCGHEISGLLGAAQRVGAELGAGGRSAASGAWGRPGSANWLRIAGVLGVADRPGQPLDELGCRVVGAQVYRLDALIEPDRGVGGQRGWIGGDDDSWHPKLLSGTWR